MKRFFIQKNNACPQCPKHSFGRRGYTLIESLIAITIFTFSTLILIVSLGRGLSDTGYAKKKIIAEYLAQEGIEYMRNMRDTFLLYDTNSPQVGWASFNTKLTNAFCQTANGCYFDDQNINYSNLVQPIAGITMASCGGTCPTLLYNSATGKYGYASGTSSGFIRKTSSLQLTANETTVYSTVYWTQGSGTYNVSFSENMTLWVD